MPIFRATCAARRLRQGLERQVNRDVEWQPRRVPRDWRGYLPFSCLSSSILMRRDFRNFRS